MQSPNERRRIILTPSGSRRMGAPEGAGYTATTRTIDGVLFAEDIHDMEGTRIGGCLSGAGDSEPGWIDDEEKGVG